MPSVSIIYPGLANTIPTSIITVPCDTSFLAIAQVVDTDPSNVAWFSFNGFMTLEQQFEVGDLSYAILRYTCEEGKVSLSDVLSAVVSGADPSSLVIEGVPGQISCGNSRCSICPPCDLAECVDNMNVGITPVGTEDGDKATNSSRISPNGRLTTKTECGFLMNRGTPLNFCFTHNNRGVIDTEQGMRSGKGGQIALNRHVSFLKEPGKNDKALITNEAGRQVIFVKIGDNWVGQDSYQNTFDTDDGITYFETTQQKDRYAYDFYGNLQRREELNGNVIYYNYQGPEHDQKLTSITGDIGFTTYFEYNADYRIEAMLLQDLNDASQNRAYYYEYDSYGTCNTIVGPEECINYYIYDSQGRVLAETDSENFTTYYEYGDSYGLIKKVVEPEGRFTYYEHDLQNSITAVTNAEGATTYFKYNLFNLNDQITDALGSVTNYGYDVYGNLLVQIDALDRVSYFEFDDAYNCIQKKNAFGDTAYYEYNSDNRQTFMRDVQGRETYFEIDVYGNQTSIKDALLNVTYFEYETGGLVTNIQDALQRNTYFEYDTVGNQTLVKDALENRTYMEYDTAGNVINLKDARQNNTYFEYDKKNRLTEIKDALNSTQEFGYDSRGLQTVEKNKRNFFAYMEYDGATRLISEKDFIGNGRNRHAA